MPPAPPKVDDQTDYLPWHHRIVTIYLHQSREESVARTQSPKQYWMYLSNQIQYQWRKKQVAGKNRSPFLYDTRQYTFYARKYKVLTNQGKSYHKRWIDPSVKETLKYLKFETEKLVTCQTISNVIFGHVDLQNKPNYDFDAN